LNGTIVRYWRQERCIQGFGGEIWAKHPLGRPGRRCENNIKIDRQDIGRARDWIDLARNREKWQALVNAAMNLQVP
jgi:hypothetical protein